MFKNAILLSTCLSAACLALPAVANPITVQSLLFDSDGNVLTVAPPVANPPDGNQIQDGAFTIFRVDEASDPTVGNGIDDRTKGLFDLRNDPNYSAFTHLLAGPFGRISAAYLLLVLTPNDPAFTNDQFALENGSFVGDPEISNQLLDPSNPFLDPNNPNLLSGGSKLVTINLLNYFSEIQLANYLSNGVGDFAGDGRVLLTYSDDAFLTGASLRLTASVPEPGTLAMLLLGILASMATQFKKRRIA